MNALLQGLWQNTEEHELYLYQFDERIEKLEKENAEMKIENKEMKAELQNMKKEVEQLKKNRR